MRSHPVPETMTRGGAQALAERIADYWRKRGLQPDVRVIACEVPAHFSPGNVYVVRSNMRGGQPNGA